MGYKILFVLLGGETHHLKTFKLESTFDCRNTLCFMGSIMAYLHLEENRFPLVFSVQTSHQSLHHGPHRDRRTLVAPSRHGKHEDSTGSHCWCQWERWSTHWSDWNEGERSKPCLQVTSWSFVLQLHTSSWNLLMMKEFGCVKAMMPVQTQHVSSSIPIISKKSGWCEPGGCVGQIHCCGHHFSGHRNWRSTVATCPTTPCHNRQGWVCCWRRVRLHHTWAIPHLLWPWFRFFRPFILPGMQWSQSVVLKRSQLRIFIMKGTRTKSKGKLVACVVVVRSSAESLPGYTTSRKASSRMCASWFFHTFCWNLWLQLVKAMVRCTSNGLPCTAT